MRVADLQQFIRSLIPPFQASGANAKTVGEIESACAALDPFADRAIGEFADFLRRAEEFDRTGIVPVVAKAATKPRAPKKEATPALTVDAALIDLRDLYERSLGEDVTYQMIEEGVKRLDKLKKPDLDLVTIQFGLGKLKTKPLALAAVREKISDYKKSHQRTQF